MLPNRNRLETRTATDPPADQTALLRIRQRPSLGASSSAESSTTGEPPECQGNAGLASCGCYVTGCKELDPSDAALVVVGEPTLAKAFDKAVTRANKVSKYSFDASADDLADALMKAATS